MTMTQLLGVHLVGFTGSALIVTGVMMRQVAWLRAFALVGSLTFVGYGILLGAWPIVLTNVITTSLHGYHLRTNIAARLRLALKRQATDVTVPANPDIWTSGAH